MEWFICQMFELQLSGGTCCIVLRRRDIHSRLPPSLCARSSCAWQHASLCARLHRRSTLNGEANNTAGLRALLLSKTRVKNEFFNGWLASNNDCEIATIIKHFASCIGTFWSQSFVFTSFLWVLIWENVPRRDRVDFDVRLNFPFEVGVILFVVNCKYCQFLCYIVFILVFILDCFFILVVLKDMRQSWELFAWSG